MEDEKVPTASISMDLVVGPTLTEISKNDKATIQLLRTAFQKAERENPGFTQNFITGVCEASSTGINVTETILLMSALPCAEYELTRPEAEFQILNQRATHLKMILSRIPQEINNRSQFLQTIKGIAGAIKELLDAINELHRSYPDMGRMKDYKRALDLQKRTFVKHSKVFSDTLKKYFRDARTDDVFVSANRLINQTNTLLRLFRMASGQP
ncbi:programmed cell death protein 10-A-like [Sycon ciliatum]|uniref:programmed cell death protein 10-A-like n=1 Tax=Sycon ciliatum TaxID=27933 RepID=UPI0020ADB158|eukprot:scpid44489/ scgid27626/ Programmed cell death protein 10-A